MLAIVLPLKSAIADYNWVPTGSMKPTILEGDLILVNKLAYDLKVPFTLARVASWEDPARGDVVVFFSPADGTRLVKRVVGIPGDQLELRENTLILNGKPMDYAVHAEHGFGSEIYEDSHPVLATESGEGRPHWVMALPGRPARRSFAPVTVPPGQYFMMGDSRDNSADSRYFGWVERRQIVGRAGRVLVSLDKNHGGIPRVKRTLSPLDR